MMTDRRRTKVMNSHRVIIIAIGSRGDVAPMIELARRFSLAGVETEVVGLNDYRSLADDAGVQYRSIGLSMKTMRDAARAVYRFRVMRGSFAQLRLLSRWLRSIGENLARTLVEVVREGDLLLTGVLTYECASVFQRNLGVDVVTLVLSGLVPSSSPESCMFALPKNAPGWLRRARARFSWLLVLRSSRSISRKVERKLIQFTPQQRSNQISHGWHKILAAVSPTLVPTAADWMSNVIQARYPIEFEGGVDPNIPDISVALDGEIPCVYVGFGSVAEASDRLASRLDREVVLAAEKAQVRVIIPAHHAHTRPGWVSQYALRIGKVDHRWLFPQVDGIVHHGGAGTTMVGLFSGTPSTITYFAFDQAFHGRRLAELGVGPAPVCGHSLDSSALKERLLAMTRGPTSRRFKDRAQRVALELAKEYTGGVTQDLLTLFKDVDSKRR